MRLGMIYDHRNKFDHVIMLFSHVTSLNEIMDGIDFNQHELAFFLTIKSLYIDKKTQQSAWTGFFLDDKKSCLQIKSATLQTFYCSIKREWWENLIVGRSFTEMSNHIDRREVQCSLEFLFCVGGISFCERLIILIDVATKIILK